MDSVEVTSELKIFGIGSIISIIMCLYVVITCE